MEEDKIKEYRNHNSNSNKTTNINCLCPLPTGNILSTIRNPVINELLTFDLKDILTPLFNKL